MHNIEQIYKEYFGTVNKYLYCLTHNRDISEELTQETFYRAIQHIDKFKNNCQISVWLCQIAKNLWYDEVKKKKKINDVSQEEIFSIQSEDEFENTIILNDDKLQLYKKIQKLNEQTREVIYLRITGELTFKEIGYILGKTESWARIIFYRGKQKLKEDN